MSNIHAVSEKTSPSIHGSSSVSEVLDRIQVRDPQHKASGVCGRRLTDFESRSPALQTTAFLVVAAFIVGGFLSVSLQKFAETRIASPMQSPVASPVSPAESLRLPEGIHQNPQAPGRAPSPSIKEGSLDARISPENLHARFLGPRTMELQWDSLGEGYQYRLYTAADSALQNAEPASEPTVQAPHMIWQPEDGVQNVWVAVKGIDPKGQETAFSRPVLMRLPS